MADKHDDPPLPPLPAIPAPWPCTLLRSPTAGRFVVAAQPIPAGRAVLTDRPYVAVVADAHRGYVCAFCLHVSARVYQCGGCAQAHYCSEACLRNDAAAVHGRGECLALVGLARLGVEGDSQPMRLAVRVAVTNAVRGEKQEQEEGHADGAAAASASSPFHTPAFVRGLDHHLDAAPLPVRQGVLAVAQALVGLLRPAGVAATAPEIARSILAIQCNAHAIRNADGHVLGLGLFPLASMLNHSCRPTAHHAFALREGKLPQLVFRSLGALEAGQELCYSYTDLLHPAPMRRAKLAAAYFFRCRCGRCDAWEGLGEEREGGAEAATDRLIERALASAACGAGEGCPGVLMPVGRAPVDGKREETDDEDNDDQPLRCSACGGEEAAAGVRGRLAVGAALLEARLRALQEEEAAEQEQEQDKGDGDGVLPPAVRALVGVLLGRAEGEGEGNGEEPTEETPQLPPLALHPQHWLVTQALLALGRRLVGLVGGGSGDRAGLPATAPATVARLWAVVEAWTLQNLWLVGTAMTGAPAGEGEAGVCVGRFPELGQRLLAAAQALRSLGADDSTELLLLGVGGEGGGSGGVLLPPRARASLLGQAFADRLSELRARAAAGGMDALERMGRSFLTDATD